MWTVSCGRLRVRMDPFELKGLIAMGCLTVGLLGLAVWALLVVF